MSYFEVFGLNNQQFMELSNFYDCLETKVGDV